MLKATRYRHTFFCVLFREHLLIEEQKRREGGRERERDGWIKWVDPSLYGL